MNDVRFAFRQLMKHPGFTVVAVLTLALGVGVNATVFGMIDALLLRPFQFPEHERIVVLWESARGTGDREAMAPATFLDLRQHSSALERVGAWESWSANLTDGADPERLQGFRVSGEFFDLLGIQPLAGRTLSHTDTNPGEHRRVVLAHGFWSRRFGADPAVVGSEIELNGESHLVVGIAPKKFDFPVGSQIWAPLVLDTERAADRTQRSLTMVGKLAPLRSPADAQAEMEVLTGQLEEQYPESYRDRTVSVQCLSDAFREDSALGLFGTLLAAAGLVLLTACLNLAALLLARGIDRGRELALRAALGASRSVLVRQLVTETAALGLVSSVAALLFAAASLGLLRASLPAEITVHIEGWNNLGLGSPLIAVIPPLALLIGLAAGIVPAMLASRGDLSALREAGRGVVRTPARQRVRQAMVAAEIAFAQALLIAAGLSVAGGIRLANQAGGFDGANLLTFNLSLPETDYRSDTSRYELAAELSARIDALPAVEGIAVANILPASGWNPTHPFVIEDQPVTDPALRPRTGYRVISPGYFETLRIPILKGRGFDAADEENGQPVIVLGAALAERFWPEQDPIGKRLRLDEHEEWLTVVGVAGDVNMYNWWDGADQSAVYLPLRQAPVPQSLQFAVRTRAEVTSFGSLRETLHSIDPVLPLDNPRTMRQAIDQATRGLTWMGSLLGTCGGIGALLAVLGIYGIMAYTVAQREHEFGVRMAVGATRRDVVRLTMRQAGLVTGVGMFFGALLAWGFGRAMASAMAGVISIHAGAFLVVCPSLALVALAAAYLPARRAALVDPMEALRSE